VKLQEISERCNQQLERNIQHPVVCLVVTATTDEFRLRRVNTMTTIAITYKAFQDNADELQEVGRVGISTARFDIDLPSVTDEIILDSIYKATNLQEELIEFGASHFDIAMWYAIKPALPANRSHTSLSVKDEIQIEDRLYSIEMVGFKLLCDSTNR
jgi:hypothetical protein